MNYIEEAQEEFRKHCNLGKAMTELYTLLAIVKGEETTLADVHDAWAVNMNKAWDRDEYGEHYSMVPFDELKPETAAKDQRFLDAIHATARALKNKKTS